jgi:glutaredoxin
MRRTIVAATTCWALAAAGCAVATGARPEPAVVRFDQVTETAMRRVRIAIYATQWCPVCARARRWLERGGYRFVEHDLERDEAARVFHAVVNPAGGIPMFDIDGVVVVGFDPAILREVLHRAVVRGAARAESMASTR